MAKGMPAKAARKPLKTRHFVTGQETSYEKRKSLDSMFRQVVAERALTDPHEFGGVFLYAF